MTVRLGRTLRRTIQQALAGPLESRLRKMSAMTENNTIPRTTPYREQHHQVGEEEIRHEDGQPGLFLLLRPVQGGAVPRERVPDERRPVDHVPAPAARVASRPRRDGCLAGMADPFRWTDTQTRL